MSIKDSWGLAGRSKSSLWLSAAHRQLNSIHKVVHWDKRTLKRAMVFFVKYYLKFLKYSWIILKAYLEYTFSILQVYIKMLI